MEREREGRGDNIKAKEEEGREEKKRKEEEGGSTSYLFAYSVAMGEPHDGLSDGSA